MAMEQQPGPQPWGRARLRPRSMQLPPRPELPQPGTDAWLPRSAGLVPTPRYPLDHEQSSAPRPHQEPPHSADDAAVGFDNANTTVTGCIQAFGARVRHHVDQIPELARKARQARVPPLGELSWPSNRSASWRWLFVCVFVVLFLLTLAVPFTFGFVVFTARRIMLMTREQVYVPVHEPFFDFAVAMHKAHIALPKEGLRGYMWEVQLYHEILCDRRMYTFPKEPPSWDLMCDGDTMDDVWNAYGFDWDGQWERTSWGSRSTVSLARASPEWTQIINWRYYARRIRHFTSFLDRTSFIRVDMGPEVEDTVAAEYPRWAMYRKKNRQAYDETKRVYYVWVGSSTASGALHMVNQALRLAQHLENRLSVYRKVYEEMQVHCFEWTERVLPARSLFERALEELGLKDRPWIPPKPPMPPEHPCLPSFEAAIKKNEKVVWALRNFSVPILEAVARIEALRCGLRQIDEQYMPLGGFPKVRDDKLSLTTYKQCGPAAGGSLLSRAWKWFVAGESWPNAEKKTCHGTGVGETCFRSDYGTVASLPHWKIKHFLAAYPAKSNCLLGAVQNCASLSTDPFWHMGNMQRPADHQQSLAVMHKYGFDEQPLEQSATLEAASEAPLMAARKREYAKWKLERPGGWPSPCRIAQAIAAEAWYLLLERLLVPLRFWQFLVAFSRGCGHFIAAIMLPRAEPAIFPSPEAIGNMTKDLMKQYEIYIQ